eukprot:gnl/MRDRNA2_/MRDRNA2_85486_c0_seq3.p1 gnl/MRDRNA2_/MRDRNA2_85486_c0~~gnl/MRDRNA2_/MRDRNA2_85486_c0_seq3.p1  ORF type:complete len:538 (+),score=86.77 gnl/MRDRNA2_/MRDRNA2_85486_c0_seq3:199-1812(+)
MTVWSVAQMGIRDHTLMESIALEVILNARDLGVLDLGNLAWSCAKIGFGHAPLMDAIAEAVRALITELRPHQLSNTAWSYATLAYLNRPLMESLSAAAINKISAFDTQDIANTAFSFATLRVLTEPLMDSLSAESLRKIDHVEPQALAFLTEVGLAASKPLESRLDVLAQRFCAALPRSLDVWRRGGYPKALKDLRCDHLGSIGTKFILHHMDVPPPDEEFRLRASGRFPRLPTGELARSNDPSQKGAPSQRRIFAYAEFEFTPAVPDRGDAPVRGAMLRENGCQGYRSWQKGWLKASTLPINPHVDHSMCAEFQVMNELSDLVHKEGLADDISESQAVGGWMKMLVSTTPCLSCLCAIQQFRLLFPQVRAEVSCIQPWHSSEGGLEASLTPATAEVLPWAADSPLWDSSAGAQQWQTGYFGGASSEAAEPPAPAQPLQAPPSDEATVKSKGRSFDPKTLSIVLGGSVRFDLAEDHNAIEVTQQAYERRVFTKKKGGLEVGFGEAKLVQFNRPGPHYFLCEPHASAGMRLVVNVHAK